MAQHIPIENNSTKIFLRKIMSMFSKKYSTIKPYKQGTGYNFYKIGKYDVREILDSKETRYAITVKIEDMPKSVKEYSDDLMGWKSNEYYFEYTLPNKKWWFVA